MATLVLAAIWVVSNFLCLYIIKKRNVKVGVLVRFIAVLLGPFAIPMACFLGRPNTTVNGA